MIIDKQIRLYKTKDVNRNKYVVLYIWYIFVLLFLLFPAKSHACSYEATIFGNHLDFKITTDLGKLAVVQYLPKNNPNTNIIKLYSPDIGVEWNYYSDRSTPNCGSFNGNGPLACNQINSRGAYWSNEQPLGTYHVLPSGIYSIDFDSPPSYDSINIEYGTTDGGGEAWTFCSRTGDVTLPTPYPTIDPTPIPTPIPTIAPTLTPTIPPTPTPSPIPTPVTKVIVAPGLGASWNLLNFINCNDNSKDWTLAPYAKSVYTDLLSALSTSGWNVIPFYYDWRKIVTENSQILANYINSNTESDEKVNFVGHSMGGLVGRSYLEQNSGGKLAKYYSAGTPHQGSALAYAPWSGGEVWNDNLIEKIAINLYLKHCGGSYSENRETIQSVFPSIQNLLPTSNYLKNIKTGLLKPVLTMVAQNNYLPTTFPLNFWGVKFGTLSGTGQRTLSIIDVINPRQNDIRLGNWIDGFPVKNEYINDGDGTVLTSSSQISGAFNTTINQSHRGLVASTEGINAILNFLGSPGIDDPPYSEENSALVIVAYPGNFYITDCNGNTINSEEGMIAIMNPKNCDYKLQITPLSTETTVIVGQFLDNNQIFYKENKLRGIVQKTKIIKFSSLNPNADILQDIEHPRSDKPGFHFLIPRIPIHFNFWGWWRK